MVGKKMLWINCHMQQRFFTTVTTLVVVSFCGEGATNSFCDSSFPRFKHIGSESRKQKTHGIMMQRQFISESLSFWTRQQKQGCDDWAVMSLLEENARFGELCFDTALSKDPKVDPSREPKVIAKPPIGLDALAKDPKDPSKVLAPAKGEEPKLAECVKQEKLDIPTGMADIKQFWTALQGMPGFLRKVLPYVALIEFRSPSGAEILEHNPRNAHFGIGVVVQVGGTRATRTSGSGWWCR